ncbi:transcriptional regulator [Paenibacillus ihbetae]|uniref:Transcriptional regulator n=1 Tax=Paenibacillus ihbetae TaxID=1870820 RepID=A0A1B2DU51_9BACL|nr:YafY family protein [Paenibacillus ihbetae]ANY71243.1 transcriptional regulator [Paenibacillus ihbetae]
MNKTERQFAIMLELQRSKVLRAEDLAAHFETSVRTIYRDMQALSEAGVPILGSPGHGYSLMEGYFLPPIGFSAEEAVALLMGTDMIEQRLDGDYKSAARAARSKIEAILPEPIREASAIVRETMQILHPGGQGENELGQVRGAILERRKIRMLYLKKIPDSDGKRMNERIVAPYGLVLVQGNWIMIARCDLRQEVRHFRLSRMRDVTVLEERYSLPHGFKLSQYRPPDDRKLHVMIRANPEMTDKIAETAGFYIEAAEQRERSLLVQFRVRQPEELLPHVLSWGGDVEVLEPESFRNRIREEAEKMLKRY